jgi:hypothetical protein
VQDAKISLMRSSPGQNLQTGAKFFLIASYTGTTGFAQEGVTITGTQDLRCIPYLAARLSIGRFLSAARSSLYGSGHLSVAHAVLSSSEIHV